MKGQGFVGWLHSKNGASTLAGIGLVVFLAFLAGDPRLWLADPAGAATSAWTNGGRMLSAIFQPGGS